MLFLCTLIGPVSVHAQGNWPPGDRGWLFPIPGQPITAAYGADNSDPSIGGEDYHSGLDIGTASKPEAEVLAMSDGKVTMVQDKGAGLQGTTVCMFHGWDENGVPISTSLGHTRWPKVSVGQIVRKGQPVSVAYGFNGGGEFQWHIHVSYYASETCAYNWNIMKDVMTVPQVVTWWDGRKYGDPFPDSYGVASVNVPDSGAVQYSEEKRTYREADELGEFVLDQPLDSAPSLQQPAAPSVSIAWEPQNDIWMVNQKCPSMNTGYVETSYPLGVTVHHTVGSGGGDWFAASVGSHCREERVPYAIVIDKAGVAHLTTEFGSRQNHARCNQYGVVGKCANTDYFAISVVGDYRYDTLTPAQETALVNSIAWAISKGAAARVLGHRDVGKLSGYGTVCPGDNIYNRLPALLAQANATGILPVQMEGEFIVDPEYFQLYPLVEEVEFGHEEIIPANVQQPEVPVLTPTDPVIDDAQAKTVIWILFGAGALLILGLMTVGGSMFIMGVQKDRNRPAALIAVVGSFVLACAVIAGVGYWIYRAPPPVQAAQVPTLVAPSTATPQVTMPTVIPDDFVGTGGEIVATEYVWEDPVLDRVYNDALTHPVIPYTESRGLSPVFWYFAVGQLWGDKIPQWSAVHGLDPNLVATFLLIEAGGNPLAHCPGDRLGYNAATQANRDKGLFQLNPRYFQNGCDFDTNVYLGPQYIRSRMDAAGGNLYAAAAGYNGGPKALEWFLASSDPTSALYAQKRAEYITFLNGLGYDGARKADIVERYVHLVVGVYNAASTDSTVGLEPFLANGSYAGRVAQAYGLPWPPAQSP